MANSVRFIKNIQLQVEYYGEITLVPFSAGDIFSATLIQKDPNGFCNIHMPDGSIIRGVSGEVFENSGKRVPVEYVDNIEPEKDNVEIEVEDELVEPIVLAGTMLSSDVEDQPSASSDAPMLLDNEDAIDDLYPE